MPHWDHGVTAESIVYIHGIGNKVAPPLLKVQWDHALYRHDLGGRSSMAYWADIRYKHPIDMNAEIATTEDFSSPDILVNDVAVPDDELASTLSIPPPVDVDDVTAAADFSAAYIRDLIAAEPRPAETRLEGIDPTKPIPRIIRSPGFWLATKLFIPDAHAYFFNRGQREAIRDRLRSQLDGARQPILLIAHSLGSMVAYDVLHEERFAGVDVAGFITFGSQLGVRAIQDRVRNPLEVPVSVRGGWHNYLDERDVLPMGQFLNRFFVPHVIEDEWVENPSPSDHDGASYLSESRLQAAAYRAFPRPAGTQ